jgi:head-tail adaptor
MGLLDGGLARIFNGAFSGIFLDATLHRSTLTTDNKGGGTQAFVDEPVKAQLDFASASMRASEGYVDTDQRIIVLAYGVDEITADDEITVKGKRWSIASVATDPATAAYELHGRLA